MKLLFAIMSSISLFAKVFEVNKSRILFSGKENELQLFCKNFINLLPDEKILDWSKVKQIADKLHLK